MSNIVLGEVRMSYVHVFQPYASQNGGEPKYSVTLLIPKSNAALVQQVNQAIEAAIQVGIAKKWNGTRPAMIASPLYDGDGTRPNGEPFGDECKGHLVMTATAYPDYPPEVIVGQDRHPATGANEVYSGCYGYVSVQFFAYNMGRNGIRCSLGNIFKTRDGDPLGGGRTNAKDDFGDIQIAPQPAQTAAYQQPTYPGQQPTTQPAQAAAYQQPAYSGQQPTTQPVYPGQQPAYPGPGNGMDILGL